MRFSTVDQPTNYLASNLRTLAGLFLLPLIVSGCTAESDTLQQALDKAQASIAKQRSHLTALESDGPEAFGDTEKTNIEGTTQSTIPFPNRTNPFEFAEGIDFDAPTAATSSGENLVIKLYGFVGASKAIVNIGGTTKMLEAGETWGDIEVVEVKPPTVRIKTKGVLRVWSLLGHHEQTAL